MLLFLLAGALVPLAQAATFYVAPSCETKYPGFATTSVAEAWSMAANAVTRMDASDANEQVLYSNLFKTAVGTAARGQVKGYFQLLGSLTSVSTPELANIIYECDNDDRWKLAQDDQGADRPGQWVDSKYHMRVVKDANAVLSCRRTPVEQSALMSTYTNAVKTPGWQDDRTVVSVCDRIAIKKSYDQWGTVSKFEGKLLSGKLKDPTTQQPLRSVLDFPCTSRTVLHESFHSNLISPRKKDLNKPNSYGWKNTVTFDPVTQLANADNYAVYAFALFLKNYRLGDDEESKAEGYLVKVAATSKRAMHMIRSLPSKCRSWLFRRMAKECSVEA